MQVNSINPTSFNAYSGIKSKEFSGELKDGSKAIIKISHDGLETIRSLDCFQVKDDYVIGGVGAKCRTGLSSFVVDDLLARLQLNAKEGVNFFQGLTRALLQK